MAGDELNLPGIPTSDAGPPRPAARLWVELAVAAVLGLLLALLALGFVVNAAGSHYHGGARAGQAVGAAISLGLLALCTRWGIHVEHRLRRHEPAAQTWVAGLPGAPLSPAPVAARPAGSVRAPTLTTTPRSGARRGTRARRRGYGPVGTGVALAVMAAITLGMIGAAISSRAQGARSGYVQAHGIRAVGVVESVDNTEHCSRGSCSYTAAIALSLVPPLERTARTVAHYPGRSSLLDGQRIVVLVDPKQPDYAEIPGARFVSSWMWLFMLGLAAMFAGFTAFEARALQKLLAHRRSQQAQSLPGVAALPSP